MPTNTQLNNPVAAVLYDDRIIIEDCFSLSPEARFKAQSFRYWLLPITSLRSVMYAVQHWEWQISKYHKSSITFDNYPLIGESSDDMARAKATQNQITHKAKADWKGFINIPLSDTDKERIIAAAKKPRVEDIVDTLVAAGKFSISYTNDAFNCTSVLADGDYAGYGVSSFASTAIMAMVVTAYKLAVYGDALSEYVNASRSRSDFG